MPRLAFIGNPNCGKSTLFNALTGASQTIGNWSGVTIERKSGFYHYQQNQYECVDLPGVYSLVTYQDDTAQDELIATQFLTNEPIDLLVNIVDATQLERQLYLSLQCRELNIPMIMVVNMMDVAALQHIDLDLAALARALNCPVLAVTAHKQVGIDALRATIADSCQKAANPWVDELPPVLQQAQQAVLAELPKHVQQVAYANRLLAGDSRLLASLPSSVQQRYQAISFDVQQSTNEDVDIVFADHRYALIHRISEQVMVRHQHDKQSKTAQLDRIVLNRWLGLPIFFSVMYALFFAAIHIGGLFQDAVNILTSTVFVDAPTALLQHYNAPSWLIALIANGIGKGINTTLTFIPVLAAMFLGTAFLEQSGYMARAAFAMDRVMRAIGLPGKAFVPLIVGFGCNVPAIMATRTLNQPRDRILTCLMAPFMSCGARLAIYAVFISAFFPINGHNVVFALYMLGIAVAIATGLVVRKTLLPGPATPLVMDLPRYQLPTWSGVWKPAQLRTKRFVMRAGAVILPLCAVLGMMLSLNIHGELIGEDAVNTSLLALFGQLLTPLFHPMGITQENWPATVGLLTGSMAKEVVIATLNTLYSHFSTGVTTTSALVQVDWWSSLSAAFMSIVEKFQQLPSSLLHPFAAATSEQTMADSAYGVMANQFASKAAAFSYLVFVLLYVPCFSTIAVTARELNRGWAAFSLGWSLLVAYTLAVSCYQLATWQQHPSQSFAWVSVLFSLLVIVVISLSAWRRRGEWHVKCNKTISDSR